MKRPQFSRAGFVRAYALPVLFIVLIPAAGWWFSWYATSRYDERMLRSALASIDQNPALDARAKAEGRAFYSAMPFSTYCASEEPSRSPGMTSECSMLRQFAWMRTLSIASLGIGLIAFVFASVCVLVSLTSQRSLHASFVAGWHLLKVAAILQAVSQGVIIVMLSFWTTVVWFDQYLPKLILAAGVLAGGAVWLIMKATFKRIELDGQVEGMVLAPEAAPAFWSHVRELCRTLGTDPPAHIIVGVDDNFFVTEHPMLVRGERLTGRTLFVSFSLLKVMEKGEADAVLAHEMAHFSGEDTLYSKRMSPALARYGEYLGALHQGVVSRPIFHFMLFFWALFQLSISRTSRQREFRADRIAAETTSAQHMGRALIKVAAYATYRRRIEHQLFSQDVKQESLGIAMRVAHGFGAYVSSPSLLGDISGSSFPHPFDSHPPLDARLTALRAPIVPSHYSRLLTEPITASWFNEIEGAEALEQQMWAAYEEQFAEAHEASLAWRYVPRTPEERAIVERHFPARPFATKRQDATVIFDFARIRFSGWQTAIGYEEIDSVKIRESFGRKFLTLDLGKGRKKMELPLHRFPDAAMVVDTFQRYSARHANAQQHASAGIAGTSGEQ